MAAPSRAEGDRHQASGSQQRQTAAARQQQRATASGSSIMAAAASNGRQQRQHSSSSRQQQAAGAGGQWPHQQAWPAASPGAQGAEKPQHPRAKKDHLFRAFLGMDEQLSEGWWADPFGG